MRAISPSIRCGSIATGLLASALALADGITLEPDWTVPIEPDGLPTDPDQPDNTGPFALVADDHGVVLAHHPEASGLQVRAWSDDGEERWTVNLDAPHPHEIVHCAEDRLCLLSSNQPSRVLDADSGEVLAELPSALMIQARENGGWVLFNTMVGCSVTGLCTTTHTRTIVDPDGTEHPYGLSPSDGAPIAMTDGAVLTLDAGVLHVLAADGSLTPFAPDLPSLPIWSRQRAAGPGEPAPVQAPTSALFNGTDQVIVLSGRCVGIIGCPNVHVEGLSPSGHEWAIDTGVSTQFGVGDWRFQTDSDGNILLLLSFDPGRPRGPFETDADDLIYLLKATPDGEAVWQRRLLSGGYGESRLLSIGQEALALVRSDPARSQLLITVVDADSGDLRGEYALTCADDDCASWLFDLGTDQRLATLGIAGGHAELGLVSLPVETPATITMDQRALNGAWFAPRSAGQGFNLRLHPTADGVTVFMPWFTFSLGNIDGPQQLHWYTLETAIPTGTTQADLPIVRTTGGQFLMPGHERVTAGQARLIFPACDLGLLDYRFDDDHNVGGSGVIALRRLLPAADDCIEADDTVTPAAAAADYTLSGTWYDPEAPGQGLDIEYVLDADSDDEPLFGTWHTYDTQDPDGDPRDQHWFTVQSATTIDGGVRSTIFQTLGGRLDSVATADHVRVGEVDLVPLACDRLRFSVRFDDSDDAGDFRGLERELELYRLGACPIE